MKPQTDSELIAEYKANAEGIRKDFAEGNTMDAKQIINLPDGYNGHTVPYFATPIYEGKTIVWLRCAIPGKEYMKRWAHKSTWLAAIQAA